MKLTYKCNIGFSTSKHSIIMPKDILHYNQMLALPQEELKYLAILDASRNKHHQWKKGATYQ